MQGLQDIGFARDEQGYYTIRLVRDEEIIRLSAQILR